MVEASGVRFRFAVGAVALTLASAFALCGSSARADQNGQPLYISIKVPALRADERITSFRIDLRGARIKALPDVPAGWLVNVDNDPSWETSVSGVVIVGAAALGADGFHDILAIEKYPRADPSVAFSISGQLVISTYGSAKATSRTLALKGDAFRIQVRQ